MQILDAETRAAALLRRRLLAAPEEIRAMATAETADWQQPDFVTDDAQQNAMHALLIACSDARRAVLGHSAESDSPCDDHGPDTPVRPRLWVASERRIALDHAIVAGAHAGRLLRQHGIKATVTTSERVDAAGQPILAHADLGFRRRAVDRGAAQ